jgi:hypothetical protein
MIVSALFALLAWLGFAASLVVHVSTFFPAVGIEDRSAIWALHVGVFVVCLPMIVSLKKRGRPGIELTRSAWALVAVFFVYALVNFALFMQRAPAKPPAIQQGQWVVYENGQRRVLTASQAAEIRRLEVRGFSGHWMLFYVLPALYFGGRLREGRSEG